MTYNSFFEKFNKDISWIKKNTIYLARHGSIAYGTNTIKSDEDFRGICIPTKDYYFGFKSFEQAELKNPDVVIYEIRKFFRLAADCNPNALEILFVDPSDVISMDSIGESIIENRNLFLSKKVKHTMTGYAMSQLRRIKSHKKWLLSPPTKPPTRAEMGLVDSTLIPQDQLMAVQAEIQKEVDRAQFDFLDNLEESTKIGIKTAMAEMLAEIKITADDHWMAACRKIGLSDNFIEIMKKEREYNSRKKEWDQYNNWKANRNPARAELEAKYGYDCKHAYHLVRLIRMCEEILTTGKVIVKRPDREELLSIRNGCWTYEQLIEFADGQEKKLNEAYNTYNVLPRVPDKEKLDKLCVALVEKSNSKFSWYSMKKKWV